MAGIFLLSSERSGTNLLKKRLCDSNNNICNVPPVHILRTLGYWESQFGNMSDNTIWSNVISLALRCCYERAVPWEHQFSVSQARDYYLQKYGTMRSLTRLMDVLYSMYAEASNKDWYFCKDIRLFDFADRIASEVTHSYFIQLVRDPRDYVISQLGRPFSHCSILRHAECWNEETILSANALKTVAIRDKCFFVTYESFLRDEDNQLNSLNIWLGISDISKGNSNIKEYDFHEWKNIHLPTIKDNYDKYEHSLSTLEIKAIESICWVAMKNIGYKTKCESRPKLSSLFQALDSFRYYFVTPFKKLVNRYRLRNENINRRATKKLVSELEKKYR